MTECEIELEDEKIYVEISKLIADTAKIKAENWWYPFVVGSGVMLAGAGLLSSSFEEFQCLDSCALVRWV